MAGKQQNPTATEGLPPRKLTRAEKKVLNKAKALKVQTEEYARASGIPPTLRMLQEAPAENLAALVPAKQAKASAQGEETSPAVGVKGRPSEYTDEEGDDICAWIAGGGSLRAWCRQNSRAIETVYRWMRQDARFHARYAQAHEDRADTLADEMIEIADDSAVNASIEGVAAAKLRVETRRFIASKLRPQKWGEKQTVEHVGAVNIRIGIPAKPPTTIEAQDVTPK